MARGECTMMGEQSGPNQVVNDVSRAEKPFLEWCDAELLPALR